MKRSMIIMYYTSGCRISTRFNSFYTSPDINSYFNNFRSMFLKDYIALDNGGKLPFRFLTEYEHYFVRYGLRLNSKVNFYTINFYE